MAGWLSGIGAQGQVGIADKAEPVAVTMSEDEVWCTDEKMVKCVSSQVERA